MKDVPVIALRPVADADLDALFDQMRDPESVWMAAFTPDDPDDRAAFDAHMAMVRSAPDTTLRPAGTATSRKLSSGRTSVPSRHRR
jgi:RimJ/RimL family protein N-acetyltransferase